MPSRQGHTKSRHGCKQCKARHVRCDQQHPRCGFCQRRSQSCSLSVTHPASQIEKLVPKTSIAKSSRVGPCPPSEQSRRLPLKELELLHHFTSVVSTTLGEHTPLQIMWRDDVPREALTHEYLMCAILALSALHLHSTQSGLRPKHEYRDEAIYYYDEASIQFRSALGEVAEQNSVALFASSALLSIFVLGLRMHIHAEDGSMYLDDISTFYTLSKGTRVMAENCHTSPNIEALEPLLRPNSWDHVVLPAEMRLGFENLSHEAGLSTDDKNRKKIYQEAIESLKEPFRALAVNPGRTTLPFYWFVLMTREFVDLIEQRDSMALVIVAHHALLLDHHKQFWWLGRRGEMVLQEICQILDTTQQDVLGWPSIALGK